MKTKLNSIVLRVCLAFTLLASVTTYSNAQSCSSPPSCIANPDIVGATGNLNGGSTGGTQTVSDWYVANGTPNVQSGGAGGTHSIGMWTDGGGYGEGAYTCFNFQQNHTYQICLWVENTSTDQTGNLYIKAANGLTESFSFSPRQLAASSELIDNSHTYSATIKQLVINYTPTANFSQLWFYPYRSTTGSIYRLRISRVNIIESSVGIGFAVPCGSDIVLPASTQSCATTSWFAPDGTPLGTGTVVVYNAGRSDAGDYTKVVSVGDCEVSVLVTVEVGECYCDEFEPTFEVSGEEQPISFTETSIGPGATVAWYWDFGDGTTSTDPNPTHNYTEAGTYEVCLTVIRRVGEQTCCKQICQTIQVGEPSSGKSIGGDPQVQSIGTTGFNYNFMEMPNAIKFSNTTTENVFAEYNWNFGDGEVSGKEHPYHVYAKEGAYKVCLTVHNKVYDANGNLVEKNDEEYCENVNVGSSFYDINEGEVSVMPNPTKNKAYVTVNNIPNPQVILRNMTGVEVAKGKIANPNQYILNLEDLPSGIYIVEVKSEAGSKTVKLIKE